MIRVRIYGEPKPQPRTKACIRGKRAGVYTPPSADGWRSMVAITLREHVPPVPLTGPIAMRMEFYLPRPAGHYGTGRNAGALRESAPRYPTGRFDVDNLAKAPLDVCTQLGMWRDDGQVVELTIRKRYADGERPGCLIEIGDSLPVWRGGGAA